MYNRYMKYIHVTDKNPVPPLNGQYQGYFGLKASFQRCQTSHLSYLYPRTTHIVTMSYLDMLRSVQSNFLLSKDIFRVIECLGNGISVCCFCLSELELHLSGFFQTYLHLFATFYTDITNVDSQKNTKNRFLYSKRPVQNVRNAIEH